MQGALLLRGPHVTPQEQVALGSIDLPLFKNERSNNGRICANNGRSMCASIDAWCAIRRLLPAAFAAAAAACRRACRGARRCRLLPTAISTPDPDPHQRTPRPLPTADLTERRRILRPCPRAPVGMPHLRLSLIYRMICHPKECRHWDFERRMETINGVLKRYIDQKS